MNSDNVQIAELKTHIMYIRESFDELKEVAHNTLEQTKATNGRVNSHDVEIAILKNTLATRTKILGGLATICIALVGILFPVLRHWVKLDIETTNSKSIREEVRNALSEALPNYEFIITE